MQNLLGRPTVFNLGVWLPSNGWVYYNKMSLQISTDPHKIFSDVLLLYMLTYIYQYFANKCKCYKECRIKENKKSLHDHCIVLLIAKLFYILYHLLSCQRIFQSPNHCSGEMPPPPLDVQWTAPTNQGRADENRVILDLFSGQMSRVNKRTMQ